MISARYNALHAEAAARDPLYGVDASPGRPGPSHWGVRVIRNPGDKTGRQWQCWVGAGTVNDRMASITYLRKADPRGWLMPPDYGGIPAMVKLYGPSFRLVDRPLTDKPIAPWLLLTVPDPFGPDIGDFTLVVPALRPLYFRTRAMWDLDLYQASVFLSADPRVYNAALNAIKMPAPTQNNRYRVWAGQIPVQPSGVGTGAYKSLATLYLLRDPQHRRPDQILVHQLCFWSLWTLNVEPSFGNIDTSLPLGGIDQFFVDTALQGIAAIYAQSASSQFWSAA